MEKGIDIDPVTGEPVEMMAEETRAVRKKVEEGRLRDQAEFLNLVGSAQGQKLISMVVSKLEKRVDRLIKDDPEATAYRSILVEMGHKQNLAKAAVKELFKRQLEEK